MTPTPSTTARAGSALNKSLPEAVALPDGNVAMWLDGRYGPVPRWKAVSALADLTGSHIPSSQARAAAIRAALKETMQ